VTCYYKLTKFFFLRVADALSRVKKL